MAHYPPPDNPAVCKVTMVFQRDTRQFVNTFHVASPIAPWTLANMTALGNAAIAWWNSLYKGGIPAEVSLVQVQVRKYDPAFPLAVDLPVSPGVPGTRTGVASPANASTTLSMRTGLAGKAYRGRMYIPSVSIADRTLDDRIISTLVSALASIANAFINTAFTGIGFPVVFHKPLLTPKPLDNTYSAITQYVIENILDSQRRRLPNRGR